MGANLVGLLSETSIIETALSGFICSILVARVQFSQFSAVVFPFCSTGGIARGGV